MLFFWYFFPGNGFHSTNWTDSASISQSTRPNFWITRNRTFERSSRAPTTKPSSRSVSSLRQPPPRGSRNPRLSRPGFPPITSRRVMKIRHPAKVARREGRVHTAGKKGWRISDCVGIRTILLCIVFGVLAGQPSGPEFTEWSTKVLFWIDRVVLCVLNWLSGPLKFFYELTEWSTEVFLWIDWVVHWSFSMNWLSGPLNKLYE